MALIEAAVAVISSSWVHLRLVVVHLEVPCFSLYGWVLVLRIRR